MNVYSPVVSEVIPVRFADLAPALDVLHGQELNDGSARLNVDRPVGAGIAGGIRFVGTLRTTSALLPSFKVEVAVSPWSAGRSEVAIHPITDLGHLDSFRANRFYTAARSILPLVIDRLTAGLPAKAPAALKLAA
jgi:hypothetical protein